MNGAFQPPDFREPDLIDRIANALPAEFQAAYYREMRFCRSLSENDEMLRILRAMQFWVLLMVQVPERIAAELQRLGQILADFLKALREIRQSIAIHQAQLDQRLVQLPAQIAEGINPEAIAAKINEPASTVRSIDDPGNGRGAYGRRGADEEGDFQVCAKCEHASD